MKNPFLATLDKRVLWGDGAVGTVLRDRGVPANVCLESVNLENPELLRAIHREYVAAGAEITEPNTFGANRVKLTRFELADRMSEINRRAAEIAREAAVKPAAAKRRRNLVEREASAGPEPQTLREKLATGRFVVSVEVDPPRGVNPQRALEGAAMLKETGVDCINVGDSLLARVHMSSIAMAVMIHQQVGVETIVHFVSRDRNLIALQSDLMGAHAFGLRNILCLLGDLPRGTGYERAVGVWDVSAVGLVRILKGMNEGVNAAGNSLDQPTSFFIGGAATPSAPLEAETKLMRRKKEAGVDFVVTQPVFDPGTVDRYVKAVSHLKIPIILGIMPLHSHRHAEFIQREMRGVALPDEVRERMRLAGDKGLAEGMRMARELIEAVRDKVQGICIMPSFGRFDVAAELVASIRG